MSRHVGNRGRSFQERGSPTVLRTVRVPGTFLAITARVAHNPPVSIFQDLLTRGLKPYLRRFAGDDRPHQQFRWRALALGTSTLQCETSCLDDLAAAHPLFGPSIIGT